MTAKDRIDALREVNPAAVDLARACALAARVEPDLLRRLRLLLPRTDAGAEADLWFSDLLAGRDATGIALDPLVAELLREELRPANRARLREAVAAEIADRHAGAHWSVRLEERIHLLDVTRPPDMDARVDELLLAALRELASEPDPRGIARWLLGATGRFPRDVSPRLACRVSTAAAGMHLDRQAPPPGLLDAGETQAWLPWLIGSLPTVDVGVRLLDGCVVLGTDLLGPDAVTLPRVPATDPLVVEIRWNDGVRAGSQRVRFRPDDPVQVETGSSTVTLVLLSGATYELSAEDEPPSAGLSFDHLKATLRPCLARQRELDWIESARGIPAPADSGRVARPAILTVEDDPGVSRAIARDLRRQYGEGYRIVRRVRAAGAGGAQGDQAARRAGRRAARRLPDAADERHRVIRRTAMDLFPLARRVLLTAYANQAINVVDLDHYLLKPWDPPEEKLYPVVDALLEAWTATGRRAWQHIQGRSGAGSSTVLVAPSNRGPRGRVRGCRALLLEAGSRTTPRSCCGPARPSSPPSTPPDPRPCRTRSRIRREPAGRHWSRRYTPCPMRSTPGRSSSRSTGSNRPRVRTPGYSCSRPSRRTACDT